MKVAENNVKYGEIMIFDHKIYFKKCKVSINLCPHGGDLVNEFCPRGWIFEQKFIGPGFRPLGIVTSQGGTCRTLSLRWSVNFES